jgi:hypothetical protein
LAHASLPELEKLSAADGQRRKCQRQRGVQS